VEEWGGETTLGRKQRSRSQEEVIEGGVRGGKSGVREGYSGQKKRGGGGLNGMQLRAKRVRTGGWGDERAESGSGSALGLCGRRGDRGIA